MIPERWAAIDRVWQAVLALPEAERAAALTELSGNDPEVRAEVESLLANLANASAAGFGAEPGIADASGSLVGRRLGSYSVGALLGVGGMGEVYQAHDATLGREVALKILPDLWHGDQDRRARFDREAYILASLNHPNVGAIYGVHDSDGVKALVLELVDGETLAERILRQASQNRGLPIDEIMTIAAQTIDALEAAHERGIVHRDLKPSNIKVTPGGRVKVLDFGLALAVSGASSKALANSPTITVVGTEQGVLLGTAAYMSPEQARGRTVDKRTDVWAFGCVLYEMLTGTPAFGGQGVTDVLAEVVNADPDWRQLPSDTPAALRICVERCLQKDPRQRFHDIADVRLAMEGAFAPREAKQYDPTLRAYAGWVVAGLAGAAAILALSLRTPAEPPETRLEIVTPSASDPLSLAISPDGRSLVFQAEHDPPRLWLRPLDSQEARPLAGTEGGMLPFWSPDSRSIAFNAAGVLKRIDLQNGLVRTVTSRFAAGGTWNANGTILIGSGIGPLFIVPAEGGDVTPATSLLKGQRGHRWPQFLPDGRRFLFFTESSPSTRGIYLGSLDDTTLRRVSERESGYTFMSSGHILYARQGALLARRLNDEGTATVGEFLAVAPRVLVHRGTIGHSAFSASATGTIAYRSSAGATQLVWLDRTGRTVGVLGQPDNAQMTLSHMSSDGQAVGVTRTVDGATNVWLLDGRRGVPRRLTFAANERLPIFSPDGTRVVYGIDGESEASDIYVRPSDGTQGETRLLESDDNKHPLDWSPDGRHVLYSVSAGGPSDLWALPLFGDRKPFAVTQTRFMEYDGRFSPDGRWIAYRSDETGHNEIHIRPFPGPGTPVQVSVGGGTTPRWRRDGREMFYVAPDRRLMAVSVIERAPTIETGAPRPLFTITTTSAYEPSPDGERFLVTAVASDPSPITVILNWKPATR